MSQHEDQAVVQEKSSTSLTEVEEQLRASYRAVASQYRNDDEIEVTTENHRHLCEVLGRITSAYAIPVVVLDAGCGTGRYFHCLKNTERLVGVDLSQDMLRAAQKPVLAERITARNIELVCGNIFHLPLPGNSFDVIYSLGMFGHGCPLHVEICNRFYRLLKPGGTLLFNVVDASSIPLARRIRKQLKRWAMPFLPPGVRHRLQRREMRLPFYGMHQSQLAQLMEQSLFVDFEIEPRVCRSPLWKGTHLTCLAKKEM
jgi:ubiquinone/menaquinone biosynthesis C-methylase UbiE